MLVVFQGHNMSSVWCDHSETDQTTILYLRVTAPVSMGMEMRKFGEKSAMGHSDETNWSKAILSLTRGE